MFGANIAGIRVSLAALENMLLVFSFPLFFFFLTVTLLLIWNTFNTQTYKWNITWSLSGVHPWRETPTGIPQIRSGFFPCVIFPWMLSFICQRSGRQEQRVKGAQGCGGKRLNICWSVLLLWPRGSPTGLLKWVLFSFSVRLWKWGPLSPQGHNSTYKCVVVVGNRGAPVQVKISAAIQA